ncbi:MAG: FHA domain-containing protein [Myxococcales bacterium]
MGGFSLTITEGKDIGREFTFDQPEVSIGRTTENDVVLYDPGVSRKHAVIRNDGGRFLVQDQGSANGTQINGAPIVEEELKTGDLLTVGPVVFSFEAAAADEGSTRILDAAALAALAPKKPAPKPAAGESAALAKRTQALPAARPAAGKAPLAGRSPSSKPVPAAKGPAAGLSAAERARLQRNAKGLGKLKLWLSDKPPAVRFGVIGGAGVLALGLLGAVVMAAMKGGEQVDFGPRGDQSAQMFKLDENKNENVYGYGEHLGVNVQTMNETQFEFEFSDSFPVVIYLRFQSTGIERKDEVDITLNTVHIGTVNQSLGDEQREQRIKLPKKYLKPGEKNHIVFDNSLNPPGSEPWAISNVRLIIKPIPVAPPGELLREARSLYDLAEKRLGMKEIAPGNRYDAWAALHKALLHLEGVEPKPDLYDLALQSLRELDRELDTICNKILLTSKRAQELNNMKGAVDELKMGFNWFPKDDHYCNSKIQEKLWEFE